MEDEVKKVQNTKIIENLGLKKGGFYTLLGILLIGINLLMMQFLERYFPKIMGIGFVLFYWGLGILLAPGKRLIESDGSEKSDLKLLFHKSGGLTAIVWIVYIVAGIAACIYALLCKYWENLISLFSATIVITSSLFIIKFLYFFIKNPGQVIAEDYESAVREEENKKFSFYYSPSRAVSFIFIIIFAIITFFSGLVFYKLNIYHGTVFSFNRDKSLEYIITDNLDKEVPVRFIKDEYGFPDLIISEDDLLLWEKFEDDKNYAFTEDEMLNCVKLPLSDIVRHLALKYENDPYKSLTQSVDCMTLVSSDGSYVNYDYKSIKFIPQIKKFLKENPGQESPLLTITSDCKNFLNENKDKLCVYSIPVFTEEFIYIWDFLSFVDFLNLSRDDENKLTTDDVYIDFLTGAYNNTEFWIKDGKEIFDLIYKEDFFSNNGLLINLGCNNESYSKHYEFAAIYSELMGISE